MERACSIRRGGCVSRDYLAFAELGTRQDALGLACHIHPIRRFQGCPSVMDKGSFNTSLTRSQEGRRQKHARRYTSEESASWSPNDQAASRSEWLQRAKEQRTEVLLDTLLAPALVPLPRLPVLLTLVEGRTDLEKCLLSAGLLNVAAGVLNSDMLQRLLPGGTLMEMLMELFEQRAKTLAPSELLLVARLVAVWRPPASCEVLAPAAAAVAAALVDRSMELTSSAGLTREASNMDAISSGGSGGVEGINTAALSDAAVLADALTVLRPWLAWCNGTAGPSSGGVDVDGLGLGFVEESAQLKTEGDVDVNGTAVDLAHVRAAIAALLRSVSGRTASEPSMLFCVLEAAVQYGVEVPTDFAQDAARMAAATAADLSPSPSSSASVQLAAQLVAHVCRSCGIQSGGANGNSRGALLTAAGVRSLAEQHLAPHLSELHHSSFLAALLAALLEQNQHLHVPRSLYQSKHQRDITAPESLQGGARGEASRNPAAGLLEALGSAASRLGRGVLVFAMECAAAVVEVGADDEGHGMGNGGDIAVWQLLEAAATFVCDGQRQTASVSSCSADELCRLTAAAVRLKCSGVNGSSGGDRQALVYASEMLVAVQAVALNEVSVEAAAALIAAIWKAAPVPVLPDTGASTGNTTNATTTTVSSLLLPEPLLNALLGRLADAAVPTPMRQRTDSSQQSGVEAIVAQPLQQPMLPYDQALSVLAAVTAAAESAVTAAPTTSVSVSTPTLPAERAAMLGAAGLVACRSLAPIVRELDAPGAVGLLQLIARAELFGVQPDSPQLLWVLHERLRALAVASSLKPADVLDVLSSCVSLSWRPAVLLREMLLPMLHWLQSDGTAAVGDAVFVYFAPSRGEKRQETEVARKDGEGRGGAGGLQPWSPREVKVGLALLAKLRFRGPLAAAVVKFGVGYLLGVAQAYSSGEGASAAAQEGTRGTEGAQLSASDLAMLLWVCVAMKYRGATVLRPLLQRLLQVPPARVPVRAVAQTVWSAVRLGVVGERLIRWALASCQGEDKLKDAAPQNLALLCWGLAKLGVRPPRAFVMAAMSASHSQLRNFKAQELATVLFVIATWGGKLRAGADAASVVRHVVTTRAQYDGPALCSVVWALQQLTAVPSTSTAAAAGAGASDSSGLEDVETRGGLPTMTEAGNPVTSTAAAGLDAAALRAFEKHLLSVNLSADPRVGFPDHHLLRYFSACATVGYRPEQLLDRYTTRLGLRLRTMRGVSPVDAPAEAERRARMLWSAARNLAMFQLRDASLLTLLELCAERCQSLLRPGHVAGILNAMAALGHYPVHWARHGLLRRVGLALRRATLTEAALIMEALAAWRPYLITASQGVGEESVDGGTVAANEVGEAGNGQVATAVESRGPGRRGPTLQGVDLLRRVALGRLTQLCAPPAPLPPLQSTQEPAEGAAAASVASHSMTTSYPEVKGSSTAHSPTAADAATTDSAATSTQPSSGSGASARADADSVSLGDAMRLLTALARWRWQCPPVEAVLLRVVARLPLERCRVPQLTTLMWALASLRQDAPELLEDLQTALLGLPPQPSLAVEMSMLESGRAAAVRVADESGVSSASAVAAEAASTTVARATESSLMSVGAAGGAARDPLTTTGNAADMESLVATAKAPTTAVGGGSSPDGATRTTNARVRGDAEAFPATAIVTANGRSSLSSADKSAAAPVTNVQLLSRPAKPEATGGIVQEGFNAGRGSAFDPAAVMAAAAAEANQRLEQQLGGPMGRSQLPTEPWAPADIFKALWSSAKMNRHPGPLILAAAERSWLQYTAGGGDGGVATTDAVAPPLHTITGLLWSLSVFRHHNGTFAQRLAQQLGAWLKGEVLLGTTMTAAGTTTLTVETYGTGDAGNDTYRKASDEPTEVEPPQQHEQQNLRQHQQHQRLQQLSKQAVQVAACLLAAQADRTDSPLNTALQPEVRARLVATWRSRLAQRLAKPPNRYQADLVSVLRKMGLAAAANVATPDGCALVDVAVALRPPPPPTTAPGAPSPPPTPPRLLALELVGRHNTAANSPRILGEAVIKYRLLQARGYLVLPIPCYEWDRIDHKDVWTKMVYLQTKLDRRTGGLTTGSTAASVTAVEAVAAGPGSSDTVRNGGGVGGGDGNGEYRSSNGSSSSDGSADSLISAPQVVNTLNAAWERRSGSSSDGSSL